MKTSDTVVVVNVKIVSLPPVPPHEPELVPPTNVCMKRPPGAVTAVAPAHDWLHIVMQPSSIIPLQSSSTELPQLSSGGTHAPRLHDASQSRVPIEAHVVVH